MKVDFNSGHSIYSSKVNIQKQKNISFGDIWSRKLSEIHAAIYAAEPDSIKAKRAEIKEYGDAVQLSTDKTKTQGILRQIQGLNNNIQQWYKDTNNALSEKIVALMRLNEISDKLQASKPLELAEEALSNIGIGEIRAKLESEQPLTKEEQALLDEALTY